MHLNYLIKCFLEIVETDCHPQDLHCYLDIQEAYKNTSSRQFFPIVQSSKEYVRLAMCSFVESL